MGQGGIGMSLAGAGDGSKRVSAARKVACLLAPWPCSILFSSISAITKPFLKKLAVECTLDGLLQLPMNNQIFLRRLVRAPKPVKKTFKVLCTQLCTPRLHINGKSIDESSNT